MTSNACQSSASGAACFSPSTPRISRRQVASQRSETTSPFDALYAVFDDGSKKLTVHDMFMMSAVTRCIVQSLLMLPASNDDDTLLLLPSLFVGSAAQLRSLLQVICSTYSLHWHFSLFKIVLPFTHKVHRALEPFPDVTPTILPVCTPHPSHSHYLHQPGILLPSDASSASFASTPPPTLLDALCSCIVPITQQVATPLTFSPLNSHVYPRSCNHLASLSTIGCAPLTTKYPSSCCAYKKLMPLPNRSALAANLRHLSTRTTALASA